MELTTQKVADLIGGKVVGNKTTIINRLAKIEEASEGSIAFLANMKYEKFLYNTKASAIIMDKKFVPKKKLNMTLVLVDDPYSSFSTLLEEYHKYISYRKKGVEDPSYISDTAGIGRNCYRGAFSYIGDNSKIGDNVKIYPQVFVGDNVIIGDNTIIYAGTKIYSDVVIGKNCTIHSGTVIGSDGFGFAPQTNGEYKTIHQVGNVIIEDNVDIGANTVIDRATMGSTIIHKGSKLDNLIQIAHNVEIGENTAIAAQTGISGSSKLGKNCLVGGQVGIVGHIEIAEKTSIGAQSGVPKSIKAKGTTILGYPAFDSKRCVKSMSIYKNLPDLLKRVEELEQKKRIEPH
ncbi:MAG: UDP-3-O-(3-hydroxymyristoyl)glucosamine N-acyltransferase [Cytophagales bacterium]|nr:UDP-3-O-(3-hydroxymyristoyl)glucosamine N-acyltransferase [Cytophagales bacterium]